jgi:hypothetical protein
MGRDDTLHRRVVDVAPVAKEGAETSSHVGSSCIMELEVAGQSQNEQITVAACPNECDQKCRAR